jgi:hypothetical protein
MLMQLFGCGTDYDTKTKFVFEKFIAHLEVKFFFNKKSNFVRNLWALTSEIAFWKNPDGLKT